MYELLKSIITNGNYSLTQMLDKIDIVWAEGKMTNEQHTELISLAHDNADISGDVDVLQKLKDLDMRVTALENAQTLTEDPDGPSTDNEYPEYVPGKWYYNGDKMTYGGKKYHCTAPSGVVCVWSPDEYPAYWEEDA